MSRFQSGELNAQQSTIGLNHHVVDEDDDVDDDIDGGDVDGWTVRLRHFRP